MWNVAAIDDSLARLRNITDEIVFSLEKISINLFLAWEWRWRVQASVWKPFNSSPEWTFGKGKNEEENDCRASCFHQNLVDIFNAIGSFERHETSLRICTKLSHFNNWNPSIRLQYRYWTNIHQRPNALFVELVANGMPCIEPWSGDHEDQRDRILWRHRGNEFTEHMVKDGSILNEYEFENVRIRKESLHRTVARTTSSMALVKIWRSGYAPRWTNRA